MKNHYEIIGGSVKVYSNGKNKHLFFFIDLVDLENISTHSWRIYILKTGYKRVETSFSLNGRIIHIPIGRHLMNFPIGKFIDHKDRDPLNNRRDNLRLATEANNSQNASKTVHSKSSKYKGVCWHKRKNKWIATCAINNRNKFLGYFTNEEDAARAYDNAAKELHKDFAKLNF